MHSSTSNFERVIPELPWRGITVVVVVTVCIAAAAWEVRCRGVGYGPTLNDTEDLWAEARRRVEPESVVIIGDSRAWFDCDLDELERGLGKRPVQLAQAGSCAYPILENLADDKRFHGTIICSMVPGMFFAPGGPRLETARNAVKRFHGQTWAQRVSHHLAIPLENHVAFLKERDLTLEALLKQLPLPNRTGALVPPRPPPYFQTIDRERRARMIESEAHPGRLQTQIQNGWRRLCAAPPPPRHVPKEVVAAQVGEAVEKRFRDTTVAVEKLRARGGRIVFVRFPFSGELKEIEDRVTPRTGIWDRLLRDTAAPGIYFEDFPELAGFQCPEWSHLSAGDSVEFSKRLVPHLRAALTL